MTITIAPLFFVGTKNKEHFYNFIFINFWVKSELRGFLQSPISYYFYTKENLFDVINYNTLHSNITDILGLFNFHRNNINSLRV